MGFVHRNEGQFRLHGEGLELRHFQPFRCHIDNLVHAPYRPADGFLLLARGQAGIDVGRRNARGFQRHDLILHQGNQRRYHQRNAGAHQGGHLIADGLARTGGHNAECVLSCHQSIDDLALALPEMVMAKMLLEDFQFVHGWKCLLLLAMNEGGGIETPPPCSCLILNSYKPSQYRPCYQSLPDSSGPGWVQAG